ncbi:hypothetical protein ACTFIR_009770 [Dictyostelium discoideum]
MYLVKFKGYPEPEWIKEVDTDCEELKKKMNSRRERENATTKAVEPILSYPLSQIKETNQRKKSTNQNTSSDEDELDSCVKDIYKGIQAVRDFINNSFEDVIVDKLSDIFKIRLKIPKDVLSYIIS